MLEQVVLHKHQVQAVLQVHQEHQDRLVHLDYQDFYQDVFREIIYDKLF